MKQCLLFALFCLCILVCSCSTQDNKPTAPLQRSVATRFAELAKHYSRIQGEEIGFAVVEVRVSGTPEHEYLYIVFDVSPAKYKPVGNKISTFRKNKEGKEYHLQTCMLRREGSKYTGLFGNQLGVDRKHYQQIEIMRK